MRRHDGWQRGAAAYGGHPLDGTARYLHELNIWLSLFRLDRNYGLVYFRELLETQRRFYEATKAQLEREVVFLELVAREEREQSDAVFETEATPHKLIAKDREVSAAIDRKAARHFSIYARKALTNGYSCQAHLVRTKAIPQAESALAQIAAELREFDLHASPQVRALIPKQWQWSNMADKVGLRGEYDYIYSFASELIHATPASITTDAKNLEPQEMEIFLSYIQVKVDDLIELAETFVPAS